MLILGITFKEFIKNVNVMAGIVLAIVGLAFCLMAMNITQAVRKTKQIKPNDTLLIGLKVASLVILLLGMVLIAIPV